MRISDWSSDVCSSDLTNVWEHPILTKHIPPAELAANNKRRVIAPESDYVDDDSAREAGKIAAAGRMVSIGAHGPQSGLGAPWEIWLFVRCGWSQIHLLPPAQTIPATSRGHDQDARQPAA